MSTLNRTMGRIIALAWSDAAFAKRLVADPMPVLAELGLAVPEGKSVVAVANGPTLVYVVLTAPRYTETASAYADIKEFSESYRDPRLFPLNWGSHDPVFTARIKADPRKALGYMDVQVPDGLALKVVENTRTLAHLVLPVRPADVAPGSDILERVAAGDIPPAIRYAQLFGPVSFQNFL